MERGYPHPWERPERCNPRPGHSLEHCSKSAPVLSQQWAIQPPRLQDPPVPTYAFRRCAALGTVYFGLSFSMLDSSWCHHVGSVRSSVMYTPRTCFILIACDRWIRSPRRPNQTRPSVLGRPASLDSSTGADVISVCRAAAHVLCYGSSWCALIRTAT